MRRFTISISLAVALLLGYSSAQLGVGAGASASAAGLATSGAASGNFASDWTKYQELQSKFLDQSS